MPQNDPDPKKDNSRLADRQKYNVISDTVTGVNVRWKDNLFQAVFILACTVIGAAVGNFFIAVEAGHANLGWLVGLLAGLVLGLFLSGLILMIYRAVQHSRGKHD